MANKYFLWDYKKNKIIYAIRASNNKTYNAQVLLAQLKNILKEWEIESCAYSDFKREKEFLVRIIRKYKK